MGLEFKNPNELTTWLQKHHIDTGSWGNGSCKSVVDLWYELEQGEAQLAGPPPARNVQVVQVIIRQDDKTLYEIEQELNDGRIRRRYLPPSDKIKPGETVPEAARRCLEEEVGLTADQITICADVHRRKEVKDSPSYPGLKTTYHFYEVEAQVSRLPPVPFWRHNQAYEEGDPVRRHHWAWVTENK